ncbi:MAG: helix-turn-helix domain-containing protein [Fluviicola sp.]|jgi:transcriptional regulator with XRE-family HTH domain
MESNLIGNKITDARKKANLSQAQLAEQLFISPQAVGKWERGESLPDILILTKLAKILGVDLNYFSSDFESTTENSEQKPQSENLSIPQKPAKKMKWDLSQGNWVDADFSGLNKLSEKFSSSNMKNCKFIQSDLSGILLKSNNVDGCDFSNSDIQNSRIQSSNIGNNSFKKCRLNDSEISSSNILNNNFSEADLSGTTFSSSYISKNTFLDTLFFQTQFKSSHFYDTIFEGKLDDCSFENCSFKRVTFQNATLLNTFFKCGSMKKIQFVNCKVDRMTYEFLRNGKADLSGVEII